MDWPKLFRDTKGMRVRTKFPLANGVIVIPAGTLGTITGGHNWSAIQFVADACACCGIQARITRCEKYAFEPVSLAPKS